VKLIDQIAGCNNFRLIDHMSGILCELRFWMGRRFFVSLPFMVIAWASPALADRTCFCDAVMSGLNMNDSVYSLTSEANLTFPGALGGLSPAADGDCRKRCNAVFSNKLGNIAQSACNQNRANNSSIYPVYWIGTGGKNGAAGGSTLTNTPSGPKFEQKCPTSPPGWMSNTSNVPGGITADGRCKKEYAIQNFTIVPKPPDGTPIGTWGFYWGNSVVAYGNAQNGGASINVQTGTNPAVCKLTPP
jgi:hypothetical protein